MSAPRAPYRYAWSPRGSGYLGAIILFDWPKDRLTYNAYWAALGHRIDRLIAAEGEMAWRLLEPVSRNEPWLPIELSLRHAGSLLAERSEWLHDRVHFPTEGVPANELLHDPETYDSVIDDCLEAYMCCLYAGGV